MLSLRKSSQNLKPEFLIFAPTKTTTMHKLIFSTLLAICSTVLVAQNDPVLFTVEDLPVHVSEFDYIYNKNNGDGADYSKKSLEEYLDLYVKFKLKVQRAKELQLDTIKELNKELEGYRKQLADSYLVDKEVSHRLVEELHKRKQTDRKISHILVAVGEKVSDQVLETAEKRINEAKQRLDKGEKWDDVCVQVSDDKNSSTKGGLLGFYTAMMPKGFYAFENAMYNTELGKYSDVFRTKVGFHILKVHEERPGYGEMEIAHILTRKSNKGSTMKKAKVKIDSAYHKIKQGGSFEEVARTYSEDANSRNKGGYLGFAGINRYDPIFEGAAFALKNNGDVSSIIETSVGYHIIKRISKRDNADFDRSKNLLQNLVSKDDRYTIARKALISSIKEEAGFTENANALKTFVSKLDKEFYSFKWVEPEIADVELFKLGNQKAMMMSDFSAFCKKSTRERLKFKKTTPFDESVDQLYLNFIEAKALEYEESNLENKYPEFKALMREYEEGILLFEITKQEVWDKASSDTTGLEAYFNDNREKYKWKERVEVEEYEVYSEDTKLVKEIYKFAQKNSKDEVLASYNEDKKFVKAVNRTYEKGDKAMDQMKWKAGESSELKSDNNKTKFTIVRKVLEPGYKKINESRGYIIADYQDKLEKDWIALLKNKYTVKIVDTVFSSLIK